MICNITWHSNKVTQSESNSDAEPAPFDDVLSSQSDSTIIFCDEIGTMWGRQITEKGDNVAWNKKVFSSLLFVMHTILFEFNVNIYL